VSSKFLKGVIIALLIMLVGTVAVFGFVFINVLNPTVTNSTAESNPTRTIEPPNTDNADNSVYDLSDFNELIDFFYDKRGAGTKNDNGMFSNLKELTADIALSDLIGTAWYSEVGVTTDEYEYKNLVLVFDKASNGTENTVLFTFAYDSDITEHLAGYFELNQNVISVKYDNVAFTKSSSTENAMPIKKLSGINQDYKLELSADKGFLYVCFGKTDSSGNDRYITFKRYNAIADDYSGKDFIFPDSNVRLIDTEEIKNLSAEEMRIARNEIYARYGYVFQSEDLNKYFQSKDWYAPRNNNDNIELTDIQKANIALIQQFEGN
jgi:hypothetical protein